ncbi:MAG: OadG family protein [Eubacteriales bacterium]|nr:OadG family protein [Eubacteriales bacterium]
MEIINAVILGVSTVFVGLVCIIILVEIMHAIYIGFLKEKKNENAASSPAKTQAPTPQETAIDPVSENRGEVVAAIAAVIAEELGRDVNAIRIKSIKRI